jgi:hypothetical protein
MNEKPPVNTTEVSASENKEIQRESIPDEFEVVAKLTEILSGREYREKRKIEDAEGLVCWDIETIEASGDVLEISYDRSKVLKNGVVAKSRITHTLFDTEGMPCGAGTQLDYENSAWVECL